MRIIVNVSKSKIDGQWSVTAIYFRGRKYTVDTISNPEFFDGVTSFDIEIGHKKTKLYIDEIVRHWFVISSGDTKQIAV